MARASVSDVRDIIPTEADLDINPFIRTANILVDKIDAEDSGNILSSKELREIEIYLAAHFYAHRDQIAQSTQTADASATFQGKTGMYLEGTQYGQTAMLLDSTNWLKRNNSGRPKAGAFWLGTEYSTANRNIH